MALTIYDADGYDSFCTELEADATIASLTLDSATWLALDTAKKEAYLRIAFRIIMDGLEELPTSSDCLKEAQALIAMHDVVNNITVPADQSGVVKKEKVGVVEVEYFEGVKAKDNVNPIPPLAVPCLAALDYNFPSIYDGLRQATLGRS